MKILMTMLLALTTTACATEFRGSSIVPNGPQGCAQRCAAYGMQLAGMVSMGDTYTDGCICVVPGAQASAGCSAVAAAPAAAGVVLQARRAAQQNQQ